MVKRGGRSIRVKTEGRDSTEASVLGKRRARNAPCNDGVGEAEGLAKARKRRGLGNGGEVRIGGENAGQVSGGEHRGKVGKVRGQKGSASKRNVDERAFREKTNADSRGPQKPVSALEGSARSGRRAGKEEEERAGKEWEGERDTSVRPVADPGSNLAAEIERENDGMAGVAGDVEGDERGGMVMESEECNQMQVTREGEDTIEKAAACAEAYEEETGCKAGGEIV
eukprot:TRINITY_DN26784_c0_g1_i1.p3 TRINITY_DN26784_c0_g1~~TRINITY_DN26784_c0_g1_i1.p3  ORF type:complete len:243 (+),score=48.18 TRINITY_DN26784_c0_g1_i1:52-729(+)